MHFFFYILVAFLLTSCDYISFKRNPPLKDIDTNVDFSTVDSHPAFPECETEIDKDKRFACFGESVQHRIEVSLKEKNFKIKNPIDEIVNVKLEVSDMGKVKYVSADISENLNQAIPELLLAIQSSVNSMPRVISAVKRGIPVKSMYVLPVRVIKQKD